MEAVVFPQTRLIKPPFFFSLQIPASTIEEERPNRLPKSPDTAAAKCIEESAESSSSGRDRYSVHAAKMVRHSGGKKNTQQQPTNSQTRAETYCAYLFFCLPWPRKSIHAGSQGVAGENKWPLNVSSFPPPPSVYGGERRGWKWQIVFLSENAFSFCCCCLLGEMYRWGRRVYDELTGAKTKGCQYVQGYKNIQLSTLLQKELQKITFMPK